MSPSLQKTRPQSFAEFPSWECVVEVGQVYRRKRDAALLEVTDVRKGPRDATVHLQHGSETSLVAAHVLCGGDAYERLLATDDEETRLWTVMS